jgi:serine/threonine protein kinase
MGESLRDGRFVVIGTLGQGSQGRTFDGVDKRVGQPVAIKRFDVRGAASWKDVDLAEREARVLQSLSHPKLPRYIDHFEEDGALYLAMEKIEGESLATLRKRGETLSEKDVVRLLRDASEVLDYLHGRSPPVIHRDLKPGNVLRRPDGSFAFVDFGAVRDKLRPEGGSTVVGTFGYMAPEQFQGRALPGSDVYALGATALTMLTGRDPEELPHKGLAIDVRAALRGGASDRLVGVLEKMLDPDPDRRASRLAPLLGKLAGDPRRTDQRPSRDERRDPPSDRFARRQARRAQRRAERASRRDRRRYRGPPFPFSVVLTLVFLVAMLAVSIATQVLVPILLTVLSLFVARQALRSAVDTVRAAGHHAVDAMDRVRRGGVGEAPEEDTRLRVEPDEAAPRARVGDADEPWEPEEDDEEEERREKRRR